MLDERGTFASVLRPLKAPTKFGYLCEIHHQTELLNCNSVLDNRVELYLTELYLTEQAGVANTVHV